MIKGVIMKLRTLLLPLMLFTGLLTLSIFNLNHANAQAVLPIEEIELHYDYYSSVNPDFIVKIDVVYFSFIDSDSVNATETRQPGGTSWVVFNVTNGEIIDSLGYPSVFYHWSWWVPPESFTLGEEIIFDSMPFGVGTSYYNVTGQKMIEVGTETYDSWEVSAELDVGDEYLPQKGTWWFDKQTGHLLGGIIDNIPQGATVEFQITEAAIDYIPEFSSLIILPLFLLASVLALVFRKRLYRTIKGLSSF